MRTINRPTPPPVPVASAAFATPVRLRWAIDDLLASDGHRLNVTFSCALAIVDEPAERKLFDEVFRPLKPVTHAAVISHFQPALMAVAVETAKEQAAETLLSAGAKPQWCKSLVAAANEVGFMCGLKVLAPYDVEVTSPTVQRERLEQMQRIAAERRSADRVGHLARAAELLRQWETLKKDVPSITPGKLLEQVNPADRGMMLDTLLMAGASGQNGSTACDLFAVSGPYLVRVDVRGESPLTKLISLPTSAGPLRSVRANEGKLLIGARSGVIIADASDPDAVEVYANPELASEHGFTSVTGIGNRIWACHRDGGLVGWTVGESASPAAAFSPAQLGGDPKHLTSAGLFAAGDRLLKLSDDRVPQPVLHADSTIVAVLQSIDQILIGTENGTIIQLDPSTMEIVSQQQTAGKITGAALLPWLSATRLLLNRAEGAIECVGLEDQLVTQFTCGHVGMRAVTACAGKVAAVSSDRQRILLWNAWDGRRTIGEVYLTGITKHRIAEIAF